MGDFLRQFTSSLQDPDQSVGDSGTGTSSDNQVLTGAGGQSTGADNTPATGSGNAPDPTDDSKLAAPGVVSVSPDGGATDEPFPVPDVEYDFCTSVVNAGKLPSGPFFVLFKLSGDQTFEKSFAQDDGLKAGASVQAVVHFGQFPNKFANNKLTACIFSTSAPDTPISCAGPFDPIVINTK